MGMRSRVIALTLVTTTLLGFGASSASADYIPTDEVVDCLAADENAVDILNVHDDGLPTYFTTADYSVVAIVSNYPCQFNDESMVEVQNIWVSYQQRALFSLYLSEKTNNDQAQAFYNNQSRATLIEMVLWATAQDIETAPEIKEPVAALINQIATGTLNKKTVERITRLLMWHVSYVSARYSYPTALVDLYATITEYRGVISTIPKAGALDSANEFLQFAVIEKTEATSIVDAYTSLADMSNPSPSDELERSEAGKGLAAYLSAKTIGQIF